MPSDAYVHGYSEVESGRLQTQAQTLSDLLHEGTRYAPGSFVLEAGCGTGGQTSILVRNSPGARFVSVDRSAASLEVALARLQSEAPTAHVHFQSADLMALDFADAQFDHVFVCFVLEHLPDPVGALTQLRRVLKPGGTLTAIEGDHGSFYCHPHSTAAQRAVECLVQLQAAAGGDARIGRRLYPLLREAGFESPSVVPKTVYVDSSRPAWVEGFSKGTFTAMVEGVRDRALESGLIDRTSWDQGIADLYRATQADGTFCYTFFKAVAIR